MTFIQMFGTVLEDIYPLAMEQKSCFFFTLSSRSSLHTRAEILTFAFLFYWGFLSLARWIKTPDQCGVIFLLIRHLVYSVRLSLINLSSAIAFKAWKLILNVAPIPSEGNRFLLRAVHRDFLPSGFMGTDRQRLSSDSQDPAGKWFPSQHYLCPLVYKRGRGNY